MPPDRALCLFRITQEALRNIARHAGATRVAVTLRCDGSQLVLTIADDGRGFAAGSHQGTPHLGLASMRQRGIMTVGTVNANSTISERIGYRP